MERALRPTVGDVDGQGLLTAGQRAEVRHRPVEANQPQQALDKTGRLPGRHAEQNLCRQARLDGGVTVGLLAATPACRHGIPAHLGVEPTSRDIALHCPAGQWIISEPRRLRASL